MYSWIKSKKKPEKLSIPVVILTGKTLNAEVKTMIGNYQVSSVFSKPYDPIKFVKTINRLALESVKQQDQSVEF